VIREIVYPASEPDEPGRRFSFAYNSDETEPFTTQLRPACGPAESTTLTASRGMGAVSRMTTPSGAVVNYTYAMQGALRPHQFINPDEMAKEVITRKEVTHDGVTDAWEYAINEGFGARVDNPDGSFSEQAHYHSDPAFSATFGGSSGLGGLTYRSNNSGKVVVERRWALLPFAGVPAGSSGVVGQLAPFNPVVAAEYTTLMEPPTPGATPAPVKMSAKTFKHDYNGNVTEVKEYDWFDPALVTRDAQGVPTGVPGAAALLRTTATSYHGSPGADASSPFVYARRTLTAGSPSLINATKETSAGPSRTRFSYDGQVYGAAPTAGNVTQVNRLDDRGDANPANDTWVNTSTAYGAYGNPSSTTDPNGNATQFFYEDATCAMPTRVVVDPLNGTGRQTTMTTYDFFTGLVTSTTDPNGQVSELSYVNQLTGSVDPFGRPGVATAPAVIIDGVSHRREAFTFYEDSARRVRVESDLFAEGDRLLKSRETRDQLGQVVLSEQNEGGAVYTISTRTTYLQAGRVTMQSRPTRGDGSTPDGWSRMTRDAAGRIVEVANFKGVAQPPTSGTNADWIGSILTSYQANQTTGTDQQGKLRRSLADALGRLVRVDEPDKVTGALDTPGGSPAQPTHYTYDALDNLRKVEQGGQYRYFLYDSLSRLVRAKNPEQGATTHAEVAPLTDPLTGNQQWSLAYSYDAAGNLAARFDARNVKAVHTYDGLNRVKAVDYSDTTVNPDVTRTYDGATLGKGRPVAQLRGRRRDDGRDRTGHGR
jgi:YD repeat-containing protein